jgi:LmbE family N-acetylglucosaminyl deacetylase
MLKKLPLLVLSAGLLMAQDGKLRIIAFGAHPDDCDNRFAGIATKLAARGHAVKFVSVTNGDAGHQSEGGGALAKRRRAEAAESGRRLGIAEYVTLDNHDGQLMPTVEVREQIIRLIREWKADIVLAPRPVDYHPDHRYTGVLIQDAAYMVMVPNIAPDTPALRKNPTFLYFEDGFQKPQPFHPDLAIDISDVWNKKVDSLDAHASQYYEWLPWIDSLPGKIPQDPVERKKWLSNLPDDIAPSVRAALVKWYGAEQAARAKHAEALEVCEYGHQPSQAELKQLFEAMK